MRALSLAALLCLAAISAVPGSAQSAQTGKVRAANPADVGTPDAIVTAAYDVISGPQGKERDWDRLRSLCVPEVRFIVVGKSGEADPVHPYDFDAFASAAQQALQKEGFYEKGIANRIEQFDRMAHVFSTYESRHAANDAKPFARGINSFQLVNDGKRWWIVDIFWEQESAEHPIPSKYLKPPRH